MSKGGSLAGMRGNGVWLKEENEGEGGKLEPVCECW